MLWSGVSGGSIKTLVGCRMWVYNPIQLHAKKILKASLLNLRRKENEENTNNDNYGHFW
jgi:hypothetical protein